jgi:glutaminase
VQQGDPDVRSPIPDYLVEALDGVRPDTSGALAQYIPELAAAPPERLAAVFATVDGEIYGAGDVDAEFTIQSISKPFTYALALTDRGLDAVLARVGVEPSGEAFNEISLDGSGRPRNPMINAGAIATHALAGDEGMSSSERMQRVVDGLSAFAGRRLEPDEAVYTSELDNAHRNLAIGHMLRSHGVLGEEPGSVVAGYSRQCALLVTARDLAVMAATLANRGVNPLSGERVVPEPVVRQVLSVMSTCGMYDAAGDWATQVGIPAKSGVAGGVIGALPGQIGIATFSPRLDPHGTSVRGVSLFERFSTDMGLHVMESPAAARVVVRSSHVVGAGHRAIRVLQLQGGIRFAGAERVVREAVALPDADTRVALDLTMIHSIDDVARRMLLEAVRRLALDGRAVYVIDPDSILPGLDEGDRPGIVVVGDLDGVVRAVADEHEAHSVSGDRASSRA